jgi:hypothetical protein
MQDQLIFQPKGQHIQLFSVRHDKHPVPVVKQSWYKETALIGLTPELTRRLSENSDRSEDEAS